MRELPPQGASPRDITQAINNLIRGRSNAVVAVTLRAGFTTTTVQNDNINLESRPILTPTTANAAAALGTTYVTVTSAGVVLITHANAATTDRTFNMAIFGG